jgi:hypothetical protein
MRARRWHHPLRRSVASRANSDDVAKLLADVHELRLTLTADLSAAASAIDADELAVARDIVSADVLEVRRLRGETAQAAVEQRPEPVRRSRVLLALPAIPLVGALAMTGAAALNGGGPTHSPVTSSNRAVMPRTADTPGEIRQTATSTLRHLERVVNKHPRGNQVVTVAAHLHDQLTAILAGSPNSVKSLGEVKHLLAIEQQLLQGRHGQGAVIALAASRKLTHLLNIAKLPVALPTTLPPVLPHPTHKPASTPTATPSTSHSPRPQQSTSPPPNPFPTAKPTHTRATHHHHRHRHVVDPLLGPGLFNDRI